MHCKTTLSGPSFAHRIENESEQEMTSKNRMGFIGRAFAVLGAATAAAAAVEGHRRPKAQDLRTLGIDPASFPGNRHG
ncbi:hypothetical protein BMJ34_26075 [Sinorhizobium medicae]|uniref:Twin-arginine translocation signal domain-containing protein n=1 Tax=Sinorhizobium medicae TaxID=110321 RepID=A0ABX4TNN2_9HYPH|nr:hypothetical protein [Sinorhizobium medicae]MDX0513489.1 hypothetical protein [Sinorhizobium medicae]MDX0520283.1 hypothetical protein [Sinorhizobium medicae]MDX0545075.1 hypothetical protein [Sinorhizobium medicae]MDX0631257.1 hypothetical protein [Sinorhizobium medicae]